ncbi:MAG: flavodoxin family protein [Bacillota bacterium]|nr:flavodoxin family protein [Bacillota bacterium]
MKVFALVGSPREGGNTDLLVEEVLAGARANGAETEKMLVKDLRFEPCQGCLECRPQGKCRFRDDVGIVVRKMDEADALVLGAPSYINFVPGHFKMLCDRLVGPTISIRRTGSDLVFESRLTPKKRNGLALAVCACEKQKFAEATLKFMEGQLRIHACGGKVDRLAAVGLQLYGQVTMPAGRLAQIAGCGAEERYAYQQGLLEKARDLGSQLVNF